VSRLVRRLLVVLSVGTVAMLAVVAVGVSWSDRAEDICREDAPATAAGYSVTWEWAELAYVCDYRRPNEQPRRVGIIDAFHGEGGRRHGPGR
jgi:hypothetical protein